LVLYSLRDAPPHGHLVTGNQAVFKHFFPIRRGIYRIGQKCQTLYDD